MRYFWSIEAENEDEAKKKLTDLVPASEGSELTWSAPFSWLKKNELSRGLTDELSSDFIMEVKDDKKDKA